MLNALRIRLLVEDDLPRADAIRAIAGWNQTLADWRRLIGREPAGCFAAEWKGEVVGTVTTTRHDNQLGWIGMMLVHPDFRRRGIATELMNAAIGFLREKGVVCIKLDATPEGAPVYERLGFRPELALHRWEACLEGEPEARMVRDPLPLPLDFDTKAFGADRSAWLGALEEDAQMVRVARNASGDALAFGMLRKGMRASYLGPISARDEASGRELARSLIDRVAGRVFWDILEPNTAAMQLAASCGFRRVRSLLRMWMGERLIQGDPALQFALADPGTG